MRLNFFQKNTNQSSSNTAKARLNNVLVSDRLKVTPDMMDQIRRKIQESIGQYIDIGDDEIKLELQNNAGGVTLSTVVPIKQLKKRS